MNFVIEWQGKNDQMDFDNWQTHYANNIADMFDFLWKLTLAWYDGNEDVARKEYITACCEGSFEDIAQVYSLTRNADGVVIWTPFMTY